MEYPLLSLALSILQLNYLLGSGLMIYLSGPIESQNYYWDILTTQVQKLSWWPILLLKQNSNLSGQQQLFIENIPYQSIAYLEYIYSYFQLDLSNYFCFMVRAINEASENVWSKLFILRSPSTMWYELTTYFILLGARTSFVYIGRTQVMNELLGSAAMKQSNSPGYLIMCFQAFIYLFINYRWLYDPYLEW